MMTMGTTETAERTGSWIAGTLPRSQHVCSVVDSKQEIENPDPYTDKYFLRTREILTALDLNPWVKAQVVIRSGPGIASGFAEAADFISRHSLLKEHGGKIRSVRDGSPFKSGQVLMTIEGPILDICGLETVYLGIPSAATTKATDGIDHVDLEAVTRNTRAVVDLVGGRPVIYMGARHWSWREDAAIAAAAFRGGASETSTDAGARAFGKSGVGTIPHVLENIFAWKFGKDRAVVEATKAFDRIIDPSVPRIALIDYNNKEITDSIATATALEGRLTAVRVDTCGENLAEGSLRSSADIHRADGNRADAIGLELWKGRALPDERAPEAKYWYGNGVTITGVYALRKALDAAGFAGVKIVLSSGFADVSKTRAFVEAEKLLGCRLFDVVGIGGVFPSRSTKMDIVQVGETAAEMRAISKAGRREGDASQCTSVY